MEDTIAALATPPGVGGIAVIRVSGKEAIPLVARLFRSSKKSGLASARSHTIHHGSLADEKGKIMDEVLVGLFRAPRSYTGEDVVEISCHGGIRLTRRILELLVKEGARHAEPGEFTKRAFLNGRIDLAQAEAVSDLIRAQSDAACETALGQLEGKLSGKINRLKEELMKIYAHLEGGLDFPDEHLEVYSEEEFLRRIGAVEEEIRRLISSFKKGLAMREGILTVIVGRPNVGKSSLLNALLERDRALVSPLPGTTRDAVEESIEIGGWALRLVDTAGLGGVPKDEVDQMGIEKTQSYLQEAELVLFVVDGSSEWTPADETILQSLVRRVKSPSPVSPSPLTLSPRGGEGRVRGSMTCTNLSNASLEGQRVIAVVNKADLPRRIDLSRFNHSPGRSKPCVISCLTGTGLAELEKRIEETLVEEGRVQESVTVTRLRHKQALEKSLELLRHSRKSLEERLSTEFILVDLKEAIDSLRELVGEVYSEDLLDVIFQEFCIGK